HFVVVYGCLGAEVVIGDPATGVRAWARGDFARQWTGNLLVLTPPPAGPSSSDGSWLWVPGKGIQAKASSHPQPLSQGARGGENPFADLVSRVRTGDEETLVKLLEGYETSILRAIKIQMRQGAVKSRQSMDIYRAIVNHLFVGTALGQFEFASPQEMLELLLNM